MKMSITLITIKVINVPLILLIWSRHSICTCKRSSYHDPDNTKNQKISEIYTPVNTLNELQFHSPNCCVM